jgi:hypothetical protein
MARRGACRPAIAYSRGRHRPDPLAVPSSSNFPASPCSQLGLSAQPLINDFHLRPLSLNQMQMSQPNNPHHARVTVAKRASPR